MNIFNNLKQFFRNEFLSLDKRIELYRRGKKYIKFKNKDYLNIQKKYLSIKEKLKKDIKVNKKTGKGNNGKFKSLYKKPPFNKELE